jgi:hypothetical protein
MLDMGDVESGMSYKLNRARIAQPDLHPKHDFAVPNLLPHLVLANVRRGPPP